MSLKNVPLDAGITVDLDEITTGSIFTTSITSLSLTLYTISLQSIDVLLMAVASGYGISTDTLPDGMDMTPIAADSIVTEVDNLITALGDETELGEVEMMALTIAVSIQNLEASVMEQLQGKVVAIKSAMVLIATQQKAAISKLSGKY